ncbi:Pectic enzymes secretion protein outO [Pragia fontium]|uniref:prepilin peptidase n=1 Tax=Pragia fontium TaxID=82985 RepID=UPI000E0715A4|nr:A24 family peptidase [Pragia fontium]SUB81699.1 Pectic enzymes secretion protein outO [Pragia fontium]
MENAFFVVWFGLFGLFIGSLITHLAYRLPLILISRWQLACCPSIVQSLDKPHPFYLSLFSPSGCPHCHQPLTLASLIPVLSWLYQQGRCRDCHRTIGCTYPFTELTVALLFMVLASSNQNLLWLIILLMITCLLITAALIDIAHQLLPDVLTLPLICSGLIAASLEVSPVTLSTSLAGTLFGYGLLWLPAIVFKGIRQIEGLGRGDMKLLAGLGAWLGLDILPIVILVASVSALLFILITQRNKKNKNKRIAFGPFLAFAGWLALLKDPFMIDLSILLQALL